MNRERTECGITLRCVQYRALRIEEFQIAVDQGRFIGTPKQIVAKVIDAGIRKRNPPVQLTSGLGARAQSGIHKGVTILDQYLLGRAHPHRQYRSLR